MHAEKGAGLGVWDAITSFSQAGNMADEGETLRQNSCRFGGDLSEKDLFLRRISSGI